MKFNIDLDKFVGFILDIDINNMAVKYLDFLNYTTKEIIHLYSNGVTKKSTIIYGKHDNNEIRSDIINIMNKFDIDYGIVKYYKMNDWVKLLKSGEEIPLNMSYYDGGAYNDLYIINLNAIKFEKGVRYWQPRGINDIKPGMEIEYYNNGVWKKHIVEDPVEEYKNMIGLLIKYNKIRIKCE